MRGTLDVEREKWRENTLLDDFWSANNSDMTLGLLSGKRLVDVHRHHCSPAFCFKNSLELTGGVFL